MRIEKRNEKILPPGFVGNSWSLLLFMHVRRARGTEADIFGFTCDAVYIFQNRARYQQ